MKSCFYFHIVSHFPGSMQGFFGSLDAFVQCMLPDLEGDLLAYEKGSVKMLLQLVSNFYSDNNPTGKNQISFCGQIFDTSRKHAYIMLTPLSPTFM